MELEGDIVGTVPMGSLLASADQKPYAIVGSTGEVLVYEVAGSLPLALVYRERQAAELVRGRLGTGTVVDRREVQDG